MSERAAKTRATYDEVAGLYLERHRAREQWGERMDRFVAGLAPGARVIDVGCGPGLDTAELRDRGLRAIGLDRSIGMLCAGAAECPGPRVLADMCALPVGRCVDGLWVNASLLHLDRDQVPGALRDFARALRPGGLLYLAVKEGPGAGWDHEPYGQARWFTYWTGPALDRELAEAGFSVEQRLDNDGPEGRVRSQRWVVRLARLAGD